MSMSDPISNMLNMIRNAGKRRLPSVDVPASKLNQSILQVFKDGGYVENFRFIEDRRQGVLRIYLKYINREPAITGLKRVSRPGSRVYARGEKIPSVLNGIGTAVISTSKGVITDKQAREMKIGGEVLLFIW
ncbi:MAG: 30S ribosomal protein S8 [Candidatus Omnitrophota bacterium]